MLQFAYDTAAGCDVAEYRGLIIRAERDDCAANPFADWDVEMPIAIDGGRNVGFTSYDSNGDPLAALSDLSDHWINRNWRTVATALNMNLDAFDKECRAERDDYGSLADARRDKLQDALYEAKPSEYGGNSASDYFDALETIWKARGVAAKSFYVTGYRQGDYAYGIAVATPEWMTKVGASGDMGDALDSTVELYKSWAFGDVYGVVIGDHVDSCWGFYGSDHDASGLADAAKGLADCIADERDAIAARDMEAARPDMYGEMAAI